MNEFQKIKNDSKKIHLSFLNSKNYSTEKIDGKSILVHCLLHKLEVISNRQSILSSKISNLDHVQTYIYENYQQRVEISLL